MSVHTPADAIKIGRIARGACRCEACVSMAKADRNAGAPSANWGAINYAVHRNGILMQQVKEDAERLSKLEVETEAYQRAKVKSVDAAMLRAALHDKIKLQAPPTKATAPKKQLHIGGTGFKVTFDQVVGFAAGLSLSLPVVSVLGLTPDIGFYVVTGMTALGTSTPWLISKSRDTEKREMTAPAQQKPSKKTRLASANADREAVILAWAKYETDVALQIDFPAMTDVRKPETAALAKALRAAEIASRHAGESLDALIRYEDAVLDLENAFKAAERAAKTDQDHPLTEDQRDLAHTLLTMAVDPAGNVHERRQAHQRLLKLLDGVIVLAEPARFALEQAAARGQLDR